MKYEKHIDEAFERLGFTPRPGQREAVEQILVACIDEKMQNVILNASTGTGKSIIGAAAAEALTSAKGLSADAHKSSIMLTATNVLAKQYSNTFQRLEKYNKFIQIKGANNYDCTALTTPEEAVTAESCAFFEMVKHQSEFSDLIANNCDKCEYLSIKKQRNAVRHLATNYSYYFIDRMYTGQFEDRNLIVWDEAHLVNDLFSEHNAIYFSQKQIQKMAQEIADTVQLTDVEIAKTLQTVAADCGKGKITEKNYTTYLRTMHEVYKYAKERGVAAQEKALRAGRHNAYSKLTKFVRAYEGRACKIDDFFNYSYEHVFEYKDEDHSVSVKPVFVGKMLEALQAANHNLFMSATVSAEFMIVTLGLDPEKTKFIKLPPVFPKENKEIVFFDPMSLNYNSMKDPATIKRLTTSVKKIVVKHTKDGERGIVLAPSFKVTQEICAALPKTGFKLFEHKQGEKLEPLLDAFKAYKAGPAILVSPSMFEGVDLPGDLSRFQVLVKAPFPSLGDKRMKFILDRRPDIYNTIAVMKMVQGAGRSVRSMDDHAITYCLDINGQRIFTDKANIWKDEFNLRFTKFI